MRAIPPYKGPKKALHDLIDEVEMKVHHFRRECWNITIELIADYLGLMANPWKYSLPNAKWAGPISKPVYPQFDQLKAQIQKTGLIEAYVDAAKKEPWDHLGDIFCEEELMGRQNMLGQNLTPIQIVDFMIEVLDIGKVQEHVFKPDGLTGAWLSVENAAYLHSLAKSSISLALEQHRIRSTSDIEPVWEKYTIKPQTIMEPAVGSGRFLIEASKLHPKSPLLLFGIEIDTSLYRACLVNMALFSNHPYAIICADTLRLDQHFSGPAGELWNHGNQWLPADVSRFYWKQEPPPPINAKHFSLAYFAKEVRGHK
jgi:hypothetical protein